MMLMLEEGCWKWNCQGREKLKDQRFMDAVKEGIKEVGVNEGDVHDRSNWRRKVRCGDP